jgi:hypothetical protein
MSRKTVVGLPQKNSAPINAPVSIDPLQINRRLYNQVSELLRGLEDKGDKVTIRERYMSLAAIARIQYIFVSLRKEKVENVDAGSAVRQYAAAFQKNGTGRGAPASRPAARRPEPEPDEGFGLDGDDGDDGDAA